MKKEVSEKDLERLEKFLNIKSIEDKVRRACALFRTLEDAGRIKGPADDLRERVAKYAVDILRARWINRVKAAKKAKKGASGRGKRRNLHLLKSTKG